MTEPCENCGTDTLVLAASLDDPPMLMQRMGNVDSVTFNGVTSGPASAWIAHTPDRCQPVIADFVSEQIAQGRLRADLRERIWEVISDALDRPIAGE